MEKLKTHKDRKWLVSPFHSQLCVEFGIRAFKHLQRVCVCVCVYVHISLSLLGHLVSTVCEDGADHCSPV